MQVIGLNQKKLSGDFFDLMLRQFRINMEIFDKFKN
jgi:hypothetical protein